MKQNTCPSFFSWNLLHFSFFIIHVSLSKCLHSCRLCTNSELGKKGIKQQFIIQAYNCKWKDKKKCLQQYINSSFSSINWWNSLCENSVSPHVYRTHLTFNIHLLNIPSSSCHWQMWNYFQFIKVYQKCQPPRKRFCGLNFRIESLFELSTLIFELRPLTFDLEDTRVGKNFIKPIIRQKEDSTINEKLNDIFYRIRKERNIKYWQRNRH